LRKNELQIVKIICPAFSVGLILLSFIFYPILAFGDARNLGPFGDPAAFLAAQNPDFDLEKRA
jgi:hypothetical protein